MNLFTEWLKGKNLQDVAKRAGLDISRYDPKELEMGMDEELEHGKKSKELNVTNSDPIKTLKIALAHLEEDPKYYTKLKKVL